jgi:mannose-6-phosphate isomerase-like protein (cupin superfamily)
MQEAHSALVQNPRAPIGALVPLPIVRTHMFGFRHSAAAQTPLESEQHDGVAELHIVVAGGGSVTVGGQIQERRTLPEAPGEHRGGAINGGRTFEITAGDVLNIPAGAPHSYRPAGAEGITYLMVKINVGLYPWALVSGANQP